MASIATAELGLPCREDRLEEMKVTFDADELASFFDCFAPLEIDESGRPRVLGETPTRER